MPTVTRLIVVGAKLKAVQNGQLAHCGACGAPLGFAIAPKQSGMPWGEWYMGAVQADGDPYRDWLMLPPQNREVSAAPGFWRREEDGQAIYGIIKPRPQRDPITGRRRLDQHRQPIRRRGGRERMKGADIWRFGDPDDGLAVTYQAIYDGPAHIGESAVLPALIDCPRCPRRNRVPVPNVS